MLESTLKIESKISAYQIQNLYKIIPFLNIYFPKMDMKMFSPYSFIIFLAKHRILYMIER